MAKTTLFIGLCILASPIATAHQDPRGDIHPSVKIEGGNFAIYFRNNSTDVGYTDNPAFLKTLYSPEGRLLAPRHHPKHISERSSSVGIHRVSGRRPNVTFTGPDGKNRVVALAWPEDTKPYGLESTSLSPEHIAVSFSGISAAEPPKSFSVQLLVYLFPRAGFVGPEKFFIGSPETIYDFPTASNLVFANGKFWIAWVRGREMVLSSIQPGNEKPTEKVLDVPGNWNSHLSLAAIGDRLCLAYHCSADNIYPGKSTIITAFLKAE